MSQFFKLFVTFITCFHLVTCDGYFTMVGSKVIRPDTQYHLSITAQGYREPTLYRVSINGTDDNGQNYIQSKDITVSTDGTQTLAFDLKDLKAGDYKLDVQSLSGKEFQRSVGLDLNTKKFSVFVQTDKSIYKPGDKVQFRVLVLDSSTRPYPASYVQIYITDGGKNRIKQYDNVKLFKGVYQDELQLSDLPVMGQWNIHVKVDNGEEVSKSFDVAEYVLPKYEVIVDSNPHVTFKDGKIHATVRAKYTYGKPVKGQATVSAYPVLWLGSVQPFVQDTIVRKVIEVDGKGSTEFDIREELKIEGDYERYVNIEAIFEEELTGRRQNGSTQITIHKFKYNLELIKETDQFKPGLPFNMYIRAKYHDGSPVQDKTNPVTLMKSYTSNDAETIGTEYFLDEHGMARIQVDIPHNASYLSIKARYLESDFYLGYIPKAKSESNQYIQVKVVTEKPKLNQEISIDVISTEEMNFITYQIIARGDIIVSKTLPVFGVKKYNFRFLATFAMIPKANLIVHYIRADGEIISDHVNIELGEELQNFIDINLSQDEAQPGDEMKITVSTKPNSYVGLLGVDQSVLLLKKGNDLEKAAVFEQLGQFNDASRPNSKFYGDYRIYYEDFALSGAVMITNGKEEIQPEYLYDEAIEEAILEEIDSIDRIDNFENSIDEESETSLRIHRQMMLNNRMEMAAVGGNVNSGMPPQVMAAPMTNTDSMKKPILEAINPENVETKTRKDFPETWIYETFEDSGGRGPALPGARPQALNIKMKVVKNSIKTVEIQQPTIRKYFPESWIFDDFQVENEYVKKDLNKHIL
ncbi:hypothetical protein PVAND_004605 [Polypedilum vanderplanki]|uniref:TEP1-F n=1 Tax=Polypedilum vanderplanki TaxID=319348 RepID=A0A9J6BYM3_POLVA|nr:hypothetical protein PVAND_004605 [Polypedilum vanderplanki]